MRTIAVIGAFAGLLAVGGYGMVSGVLCPAHGPGADAGIATAGAAAHGTATGSFDPAMSGVCRFSCSAQRAFDESEVVSQPGAVAGRLTRCPVSGVVFEVDDHRPRVALATGEYVVCCDGCAEKLRKDPGRFVRS